MNARVGAVADPTESEQAAPQGGIAWSSGREDAAALPEGGAQRGGGEIRSGTGQLMYVAWGTTSVSRETNKSSMP